MQTTIVPAQRAPEFGIYRDGDSNLKLRQARPSNRRSM